MHGTTQNVLINSEPPGASIYVNNQPFGQTPQVVCMKRKYTHHIYLLKEGHEPYYCLLKPQFGATTAGNLGYIGAGTVIGASTGLFAGSQVGWLVAIVYGTAGGILGIAGAACGIGVDLVSGAAYNFPPGVNASLRPYRLS